MSEVDADDLYGLPFDRFVAERGVLAKALRSAGERERAAEVAALRKPSLAAWAVNQLVRTQHDAVADLFATGDALRDAQADLLAGSGDGRALRAAGEAARAAVQRLVETARGLLTSDGHELSETVVERVADTLHAAALDEHAREQVREGRLERELRHVGLGLGEGRAPVAAPPRRRGSAKAQGEGEATGDAKGEGETKGAGEGEAKGEGEGKAKGKGEGKAKGKGEGEGEAKGEGEREAKGEGEARGAAQAKGEGDATTAGEAKAKRTKPRAKPTPAERAAERAAQRERAAAERAAQERAQRERDEARKAARSAESAARRRAERAARALSNAQERHARAAQALAAAEEELADARDEAAHAAAAHERAQAELSGI